LKETVSLLRASGFAIQSVAITPMLEKLSAETRLVMYYEAARFHEVRFREYGDRLEDLAELVREGLEITDVRYREALACIAAGRETMARQYKSTPVILAPAATGPAPRGLTSTGDPRVNAPWTALGGPALSLPMPVGPALPLGLQLAAAPREDARVLQMAVQIERRLAAV
jgi:Asp-tRNA(Asn)/Glu-tRNA(Gln) amidotransferase A subunit family amidase